MSILDITLSKETGTKRVVDRLGHIDYDNPAVKTATCLIESLIHDLIKDGILYLMWDMCLVW